MLADIEVEIAKLIEYMFDSKEEVNPNDAASETTAALGRLEEDIVKSTPVVERRMIRLRNCPSLLSDPFFLYLHLLFFVFLLMEQRQHFVCKSWLT